MCYVNLIMGLILMSSSLYYPQIQTRCHNIELRKTGMSSLLMTTPLANFEIFHNLVLIECYWKRWLCLLLFYNLMIEVSFILRSLFFLFKIERASLSIWYEEKILEVVISDDWQSLCLNAAMGICVRNSCCSRLLFITFLCALTIVNDALSPDGTSICFLKISSIVCVWQKNIINLWSFLL